MKRRDDCEACKEFHERFCCRRRPGFFKILDDDFSSNLVVHEKLLSELKGEIMFNIIQLKGLTGQAYEIIIKKTGDSLLFKDGWQDFAAFNTLQSGDVLFFFYEGHSIFTVYICDRNGKMKSSKRGRDEENGEEAPHGKVNNEQQAPHCKVKNEQQAPHCEVEIPDVVNLSSDSEIEREQKPTNSGSSSGHGVARKRTRKIFISARRPVTDLEIKNALCRAKEFQSSNPCFSKTMRTSSVYYSFYLVVPIEFCRNNLPAEKSKVSLIVPSSNKKWQVHCTKQKGRQPLWRFMGGWSTFVLDNNLEEGDVCVFEMKAAPVLTVHIFRVVEEIVKLKVSRCKKDEFLVQ